MIMIKDKNIFILSLIFFFSGCETLKDIAGISKPVIEDSIVNDTPDLILPPDFQILPSNEQTNSYTMPNPTTKETNNVNQNFGNKVNQYSQPQVKNYIAPKYNFPTSKSPSDSIDKFMNDRRFTIGEWVYGQSVNQFRGGNIYYVPRIDKGYNFSRRYFPQDKVQNYSQPMLNQYNIEKNDENYSDFSQGENEELINIEQVPILD